MKSGFVLICLCLLCIALPVSSVSATPILTYDYIATATFGYTGGPYYAPSGSRSDTQHNGMAVTNVEYGMSDVGKGGSYVELGNDHLSFFSSVFTWFNPYSAWAMGEITGTVNIAESAPTGDLIVSFQTSSWDNPDTQYSGIYVYDDTGNTIWEYNNFDLLSSTTIPVLPGQQFYFDAWQWMGTPSNPLPGNYPTFKNVFVSRSDVTFSFVPEPATFLLLGLGGLFLRRKRCKKIKNQKSICLHIKFRRTRNKNGRERFDY